MEEENKTGNGRGKHRIKKFQEKRKKNVARI